MKKNKKRKIKKAPLRLISIKVDDWDLDQLKIKAGKNANGNLSAWLRHAGRMYNPRRGEKVPLKAS